MGIVCSKSKSHVHRLPSIAPPQYQTQFGETPINFKIIIQNIKIKNSPFDEQQVHVQIDDSKEFMTSVIQNNTDPHWKIVEKFDYTNTQDGLRQSYFTLTVYYFTKKRERKQFSRVKFLLWDVAVGPIHHDLYLESKNFVTSKSRITFDVRMVQRVTISIVTRSVKCDLLEQLIEKAYNFQLRIKSHKLDYESDLSPNCANPQYVKRLHPISDVIKEDKDKENSPHQKTSYIKSVGDLKLVKNSQEYEINDLYDQFNHDNEMDENIKKIHTTILEKQPTPNKTKMDDHQQKVRRAISSHNMMATKRNPNMPFTVSSITTHPLKMMNHLSHSMHQLEKQPSYFSLTAKRDLSWLFKGDKDQAPSIDFEIYMDEFTSSTFEFVLWGNKRPDEVSERFSTHFVKFPKPKNIEEKANSDLDDSMENYIDYKIIGHCYISMNRFCSSDVNVLAEVERTLIQEVRLEESLQKHGIAIGSVKGEFLMRHNPFIRQMMGGIRTEQGIQKASMLFVRKDKYASKDKMSFHINKIMEIRLHMDDLMGNLNSKDTTHRQRLLINEQIADKLRALEKSIDEENQELYRNEEELDQAQNVLIDISKNLLENADMVDEKLRSSYYELLVKLVHRPEFQLTYMGFDKKQQELWTCKDYNTTQKLCKKELEFLIKKQNTQLHYQSFLYKTLDVVFQKIQQRVSNQWENQFMYHFLVQAYFRIPHFRKQFINALAADTRVLNPDIEKVLFHSAPAQNDFYWFITEWDRQFYDFISKTYRGQEHMITLNKMLSSLHWNKIVVKQTNTILHFINQICQDIKKAKGHLGTIPWMDLPGYAYIVRQFLFELRECEQYPYPDIMKDVSCSLLENESLLNVFLTVLYNKTRIYDSISVYYTFDMICFWFEYLKRMNKKIPTDFNFKFFMKGIYTIFEGDHALSIAKAIQIVYSIFPQLPVQVQGDFCDCIFDKYFFKLFMFWSKTVRWVFQQFLIFRIQHLFKNPKKVDFNKIRDVEKEFNLLKTKRQIKHTQQQRDMMIGDLIYLKYSEMLEIVIKVKKIMIKASQKQDKNNYFESQLEANSWQLKLIKEKIIRRKKRRSSESPGHDEGIDFSIQSLRSSVASMSRHQNSQSIQYQSEDPDESSVQKCEPKNPQDESYFQAFHYEERSLTSMLDLDELINELAGEKKTYQTKRQRIGSVELVDPQILNNKQHKTPKKVTIYHHMNRYLDKPKKLQMPKDVRKYLMPAMTEWGEQQGNYKRWFQMKRGEMQRKRIPEDEIIKQMFHMPPPDINLRVPKDESESNVAVEEDW